MNKGPTYDFGEAFARLTCVLEDTASLATQWQSSKIGHDAREGIVQLVGEALSTAIDVLNEIKEEMDREQIRLD